MGGYAFDSVNGGGFGGGTIGYNWQFPGSQFVFGIEVDAAGASIKESQAAIVNGAVGTVEDKMDALGSVTGRVGVAVDAALFYAKGGYAWANNKLSASVPALGFAASDSHVHSGYTIGGGIEYMFAPNWSAKAEYMFTHLDSKTYTLGGLAFDSGTAEFSSIKVGVNYHFR
jgi:outer membrane immunogenic protein